MHKFMINLNTIDKVKKFSAKVAQIECDMDIKSGRYIIDAKSIMGIFALDLSHDLNLEAHTDDANEITKIDELLAEFKVQ